MSVYDQNPALNSQVPTIGFPPGASFPSRLFSFLSISLAPYSTVFLLPSSPTHHLYLDVFFPPRDP